MKLLCFTTIINVTIFHFSFSREITSPPRIVRQPPGGEIYVNSNNNFFLECEAGAEPLPQFYWHKNGKLFNWEAHDDRIIMQIGRGTLVFLNFDDTDAGYYQCFAENKYGIATSNSVYVQKIKLDLFENEETLVFYGDEGKPFTLKCPAPDGKPQPRLFWALLSPMGTFETINDTRLTTNPEGNLFFSNLAKEDASNDFMYACVAFSSNTEYKLARKVRLNVAASGFPSLNKEEPVLQYVSETNENELRGNSVELFCIFGGTPLPEVAWVMNGKPVMFSERIVKGNYGKSLIIKSLNLEDEGTYTCEVNNGIGHAKTHSTYLKVLATPYFTEKPEYITTSENETVEFRCMASGIPEPEIKWIFNGKPIEMAAFNNRRRVDKHSIIIENLTMADTGNYGCNASNSLGYVYKDGYVNILALAPEIVELLTDKEVAPGQEIKLDCKVFGSPKPTIKWFHNGEELLGDYLHITNVKSSDAGWYSCQGKNKYGILTMSFELIVEDVSNPPVLPTIQCFNYSVILTWTPMSDQPILNYEIEFRLNNGTWEKTFYGVPSDNTLFAIPINSTGNYSFRIKANSKVGFSEASLPSSTCEMHVDVPYKNPDNVSGEGTQPDNLVIRWSSMPPIEHNGPGFFYTIYWKIEAPGESYHSKNITNYEQNELIIWNQPSFQKYRIKVSANNVLGEANTAPIEILGYSGEDVPESSPTNFALVNISSPTKAVLKWNPVALDAVKGHFQGYKIKTWTSNILKVKQLLVEPETSTAEISNFVPYVENFVQICVYNRKYNGPYSDILSFHMPEGVPDKVASLNVWQLSSTALYLRWGKPEKSNGILIGYEVRYAVIFNSTNGDGEFITRNPSITDSNQLQAKLSGVKPNKRYRISVTAKTSAGESMPYYIEQTIKDTIASVPSVPNFQWQILNYDKNRNKLLVKVTWLPNFSGHPGSHFFVMFKKKIDSEYVKTPPEYNEDYIVIQGLTNLQIYEFALVAVDGSFETKSNIQEIYFNAEQKNTVTKNVNGVF